MKIKGDTELYVVGAEGVSAMTLSEVANAFCGGMSAAEVTVCTDRAEALAGRGKALTELCAKPGGWPMRSRRSPAELRIALLQQSRAVAEAVAQLIDLGARYRRVASGPGGEPNRANEALLALERS